MCLFCNFGKYTVSGYKVTPKINCYTVTKTCQLCLKFWKCELKDKQQELK